MVDRCAFGHHDELDFLEQPAVPVEGYARKQVMDRVIVLVAPQEGQQPARHTADHDGRGVHVTPNRLVGGVYDIREQERQRGNAKDPGEDEQGQSLDPEARGKEGQAKLPICFFAASSATRSRLSFLSIATLL